MLTIPDHFLVFHVFENGFQNHLLYPLPRHWGKLIGLQFPASFFLPFLKIGVSFAFFLETFLDPHDPSEIIKSGLTVILASCQHFWVHPMDLCMSTPFRCSLICSSSTDGMSSLLQAFPLALEPGIPKSKIVASHDNAVLSGSTPVNHYST